METTGHNFIKCIVNCRNKDAINRYPKSQKPLGTCRTCKTNRAQMRFESQNKIARNGNNRIHLFAKIVRSKRSDLKSQLRFLLVRF